MSITKDITITVKNASRVWIPLIDYDSERNLIDGTYIPPSLHAYSDDGFIVDFGDDTEPITLIPKENNEEEYLHKYTDDLNTHTIIIKPLEHKQLTSFVPIYTSPNKGECITDITLPNTIKRISSNAFYNVQFDEGKILKLPLGITHLGDSILDECTGLSEIHFPPTIIDVSMTPPYNSFFNLSGEIHLYLPFKIIPFNI